MGLWKSIKGTSLGGLFLGFQGVFLKNSGGNLLVRNTTDNADANVTAAKVSVSGDVLELNSDAAGTGNDFKLTLERNAAQAADYKLTFPTNKGTNGQVIGQVDDSGGLGWVNAGSTTECEHIDVTPIAFGTTSPATAFTLPANAYVTKVQVVVDTAFNGSNPQLSLGVAGNTAKFLPTTASNLAQADIYEYEPALATEASAQDLIITFNGGTSTQGAGRVLVFYTIPS